jgi:hypothetical protein
LAAIKSRARKEMEAEKKNEENKDTFTHSEEASVNSEVPGLLATNGVFFQCPMIGKYIFIFIISLKKNSFMKINLF